MTRSPKITYLVKRWQHHTASGGYDRLAEELQGRAIKRVPEESVPMMFARAAWKKLVKPKPHLMDYRAGDFLAECKLLLDAQINRPDLVHVLYGDEQLDLLLRHRKWLRVPLVVTFHLPTNRIKERFEITQKDLLQQIDAAIVVSSCQLPDFQQWLGKDKVVYVPHGIDLNAFKPPAQFAAANKVRFVIVGEHMRDWAATHQIIDECNRRHLPVEFDVVSRAHFWPHFTGCENVRFHAGISEPALVDLYQRADALLMPVLDSTANNAALEAIACGTPVISNAVGGMSDYVSEHSGWLYPKGEVNAIVGLIANICNDGTVARNKRVAAREESNQFDWANVAGQLRVIYQAILQGGSPADSNAKWQQEAVKLPTAA